MNLLLVPLLPQELRTKSPARNYGDAGDLAAELRSADLRRARIDGINRITPVSCAAKKSQRSKAICGNLHADLQRFRGVLQREETIIVHMTGCGVYMCRTHRIGRISRRIQPAQVQNLKSTQI